MLEDTGASVRVLTGQRAGEIGEIVGHKGETDDPVGKEEEREFKVRFLDGEHTWFKENELEFLQ